MVFVYPCIVSENVNRGIVPAAAKSMELFYLNEIQSAFNDGILSCVQNFDYSRGIPGAITFESKEEKSNKELIYENKAFTSLDNVKMLIRENSVIYQNNHKKPRISANDDIREIIKESQDIEEKLHGFRIQLKEAISSSNRELSDSAKLVHESICKDIVSEHQFRALLEKSNSGDKEPTPKPKDEKVPGTTITLNTKSDDSSSKSKSDNYKKSDDIRMNFTPTSMPLEVDCYVENRNGEKKRTRKMIMLGVKVIPIVIKNFDKVNDALMNDYFSKVSEYFFKNISRKVGKFIMGKVRRAMEKVGIGKFLPDPTDYYYQKKGDIVSQMITMAPSNFINASAFRSNLRDAPQNRKVTSSVVMFNKDDIDEDISIFQNRSAMQRLFRLGWTSFAVLDPVKEVMYFISNLDGGYLHELPYSYMFHSLNAVDIYKNETALKSGTRPFSIRKGNFSTFARTI